MLDRSTSVARAALLLAIGAAPMTTVHAQSPMLSAAVGLNSAYVWRGVTSTNRFVLDPELSLAIPLGTRSTLSVGAWANAEPGHYDGPRDISPLGGSRGPFVTSSQLWIEGRRAFGGSEVTVGATRYLYPHVGDLAALFTTTELYALASVPALPGLAIAPSFAVYYDVGTVRGAYFEGTLERDVAVSVGGGSHRTLSLATTVGWSAGQGAPGHDRAESANFAHDGPTHLDLSASTALEFGGVTVTPTAHYIVGRDALTRVTAPGESRRGKLWLGTTLSWSAPLRRTRAAVAARPAADSSAGQTRAETVATRQPPSR